MNRLDGMQRHIALSLLTVMLVAVAPALAQPQEPQQPAPAPTEPKPTNAKDGKDKEKQNGTVGKSKLERETGTVNDRIFEVLPNYGTVENANELPPLRSSQK